MARTSVAIWGNALLLCSSVLGQHDLSLEDRVLAKIPAGHSGLHIEPFFGPLGDRVLYVVTKDGRDSLFEHGRQVGKAHVFLDSITFSTDGRRAAWRSGDRTRNNKAERWQTYLDGKPQKTFSWIGPASFRPDAAELAYWAADKVKLAPNGTYTGGQYFVVKGKSKGTKFENGRALFKPRWSADGKQLAYTAMKSGSSWVVMVGKKQHGPYPMASLPTFAPSGKKVAWAAVYRSGAAIFDARSKKKPASKLYAAAGAPVFDAKGKKMAFVAREGQSLAVVFAGKMLKRRYGGVRMLAFSPGGKQVAFAARDGQAMTIGPPILEPGLMGGGAALPPGMKPPAGGATVPGSSESWYLVLHDKKIEGIDCDQIKLPAWSADGKQVAFAGRKGKQWHVFVLAARGKAKPQKHGPYDFAGSPKFSANGNKLAFGIREGRELRWRVLDLK